MSGDYNLSPNKRSPIKDYNFFNTFNIPFGVNAKVVDRKYTALSIFLGLFT